MNRSITGILLLLAAVVASYNVIGPVECCATAALALMTHFARSPTTRNVCLGLLSIRIALGWVDWFIVDFWLSAGLLLCRQLLLLSTGGLILKGLLSPFPIQYDPPLPVRRHVLAGIGCLIVALGGIGGYLIAGAIEYLVAAAVATVAHIGLMSAGIRRRSGFGALSYPVAFLAIGAPTVQLLPQARDLNSIWVMERQAQSLTVPRWRDTRPSLEVAFECLRHKDSVVRGIASGRISYAIIDEIDSAYEEFAAGLNRVENEDWWQHSWYEAQWPTPPITKRALPLYIDLLNNGTSRDRMNAAYGISTTGPKGIPALPGLLNLLQEYGDDENHRVPANLDSEEARLLQILQQVEGTLAAGPESGKVRNRVAQAIGDLGPGAVDAVPELTPLLQDIGWPIRVSAADALRLIGPPAAAAIPALEQAANDEMFGDQARVAAANAIWWIDRSHSLVEPTFRSILANDSVPQPWMDGRAAAARALQFMGPQIADWAVEPLLQLLKHEDQEMRKSAFEALCWIGGSSAQAVEAVVRLPERKEDDDIVPPLQFRAGNADAVPHCRRSRRRSPRSCNQRRRTRTRPAPDFDLQKRLAGQ